jgi:ABC-type nitrate/sulfonate/bicarbonate transport system substrate-binding protein
MKPLALMIWVVRLLVLSGLFLFSKPGAAADKLRIGYGAPTVTMAPLWIAQEGKIFPRNGLDVEVLYLESALVQRALIAGEIQFGEMTGALLGNVIDATLLQPPRHRRAIDAGMKLLANEELDKSGYIDRLYR